MQKSNAFNLLSPVLKQERTFLCLQLADLFREAVSDVPVLEAYLPHREVLQITVFLAQTFQNSERSSVVIAELLVRCIEMFQEACFLVQFETVVLELPYSFLGLLVHVDVSPFLIEFLSCHSVVSLIKKPPEQTVRGLKNKNLWKLLYLVEINVSVFFGVVENEVRRCFRTFPCTSCQSFSV